MRSPHITGFIFSVATLICTAGEKSYFWLINNIYIAFFVSTITLQGSFAESIDHLERMIKAIFKNIFYKFFTVDTYLHSGFSGNGIQCETNSSSSSVNSSLSIYCAESIYHMSLRTVPFPLTYGTDFNDPITGSNSLQ